jgi:hypothetical protein
MKLRPAAPNFGWDFIKIKTNAMTQDCFEDSKRYIHSLFVPIIFSLRREELHIHPKYMREFKKPLPSFDDFNSSTIEIARNTLYMAEDHLKLLKRPIRSFFGLHRKHLESLYNVLFELEELVLSNRILPNKYSVNKKTFRHKIACDKMEKLSGIFESLKVDGRLEFEDNLSSLFGDSEKNIEEMKKRIIWIGNLASLVAFCEILERELKLDKIKPSAATNTFMYKVSNLSSEKKIDKSSWNLYRNENNILKRIKVEYAKTDIYQILKFVLSKS